MSGTGCITEDFGGEARSFRVALGELRQIQETCDAGPPIIAARLAHCATMVRQNPKATAIELAAAGLGDWRVDDVREPIFRGLIGGGMAPNDAGRLVAQWIDRRGFKGLVENAELALTLVVAGVDEPEGASLGEPVARASKPRRSRAARSTSAGSTELASS